MDALLEEMNRKRKFIEENEVTKNKQYFKRGDLLAQERDEILKERAETDKKKAANLDELRDMETGDKKSKRDIIMSMLSNEEIPREDVIKRLRLKDSPIRLFGETDADTCRRLKIIEMMDREDSEGTINDFQNVLDKLESEYYPGCAIPDDDTNKLRDFMFVYLDTDYTFDELKELVSELREGAGVVCCKIVINFLKVLLNMWAKDLNNKTSQERANIKIRMDGARFEQTNLYLRPLFKKLETNTVNIDIMDHIVRLTAHCLERDYLKANDVYLQMAIGNAPWPIGVTMVCIHARTGRERIHTRHVAHVLNDETQRKYIQGIKRLMTLCQRKYPSDPSKSVEYVKP